jgi:hypothetical protein
MIFHMNGIVPNAKSMLMGAQNLVKVISFHWF